MAFLALGGSNYPYAVARVQAKRSKLIPPSEYEKLLKMDVAEITRYIEESAYKAEVDELAGRFTGLDLLEAALTLNLERTNESIRGMVAGGAGVVVAMFLDRSNYANLKTVLRGKQANASRDELLRELLIGNPATYELFAPLIADEVKTLPEVLVKLDSAGGAATTWAAILRKVPAGSPLPHYEDALDKAYYSRLLTTLEESREKGAKDLLEFVRREVDTRNLLNAARWVAAKETGDFSQFVIPGGKALKVAEVIRLAGSKDLTAFGEALADSKIYGHVKDGLEATRASGRLGSFQAAVWRHHLADLDHLSHSHPLSLIPILIFLIRKQREVAILRAVARGKAAGLSENRLKELVL